MLGIALIVCGGAVATVIVICITVIALRAIDGLPDVKSAVRAVLPDPDRRLAGVPAANEPTPGEYHAKLLAEHSRLTAEFQKHEFKWPILARENLEHLAAVEWAIGELQEGRPIADVRRELHRRLKVRA